MWNKKIVKYFTGKILWSSLDMSMGITLLSSLSAIELSHSEN